MINKVFRIKFQCRYPNGNIQNHWQDLPLNLIPRWIDNYAFTHPECESISVHVAFYKEVIIEE